MVRHGRVCGFFHLGPGPIFPYTATVQIHMYSSHRSDYVIDYGHRVSLEKGRKALQRAVRAVKLEVFDSELLWTKTRATFA